MLAPCLTEDTPANSAKSVRSPQKNDVLLSATSLFVSRETHEPRDITVFRELALNLLPQTSDDARRKIACHLIRHPDSPVEVLKALGADEDALTAYPVLRNSPGLGEEILTLQAERGTDSLRKAIADRSDLTDPVILALGRHGDSDVISQLLARPDITLSEELVSRLCERAGILSRFGDELIARKALKSEHLLTHFPRLGADLRKEAIASAELSSLVQMARSGVQKPPRPVFKQDLLQRIETTALSDGKTAFIEAMTYALGLPQDLIQRAVEIDTGETLIVCLKALGFTEAVTGRIIIRLLGARLPLPAIRDLLDIFVNISHGAALLLVNRWIGGPDGLERKAEEIRHQPVFQESTKQRSGADTSWQEIEEIEKILHFGS